jgi:uncharacterized protein (DUF1501 family)
MNKALGPSRRDLLLTALGVPCAASLSWASTAQALGERRFVFILLRGGLDGLTAVPAIGDPAFASARGSLALGAHGDGAALPLDGFFALHPLLPHLHMMYTQRELLVVHAVATPYRERSHFDAQNLLESGGTTPFALNTGWLNRALHHVSPNADDAAMALGASVPLVLQGPGKVSSHAPAHPRRVDDDLMSRLARMYAPHAEFGAALERARAALATVQRAGVASDAPAAPLVASAQAAARLLSMEAGPRVAVLEADGYDSHATQASPMGLPARELRSLDTALHQLQRGLGAAWRHTLVAVATEFGRTVAPNGSGGTDHGTAAAMFLAGGAVAGGRVLADWPGLRAANLHDGRDLKPTTDLFAVVHSALAAHWRQDPKTLAAAIAPGRSLAPIDGLVRA